MPTGTIAENPVYHKLMIHGADTNWYGLPDGAAFAAGNDVTFTVWVRPGSPPGFYYAQNVALAAVSLWAAFKFSAPGTPPVIIHLPSIPAPPPTPSAGGGQAITRVLLDKTAQNDYLAIMKGVNTMTWSGSFGPTVNVETKLKWDNADCRELYLKVKEELHDKSIVGTRFYYYVGAIGNWGKAGFRITGHSKRSEKVEQSVTHGVLHIENS